MKSTIAAPLRDYQQLVRIVRDKGVNDHYQLANAYGLGSKVSHTELRMRTLEELGEPSSSPRRPAPTVSGGEFSKRDTTIMYHQLNPQTRGYFSGVSPNIVSRNDSIPGTKLRTGLGSHSFSNKIEPSLSLSPMAHSNAHAQPKHQHQQSFSSKGSGFNSFRS
ncbi:MULTISPECIES: hypothetical protein [unclassified Agarivorans]|uniref:hypothetical protein n=1 Tax=unclassified Agarivorans TaxID=2636026 RepID=UPI003D7D1426